MLQSKKRKNLPFGTIAIEDDLQIEILNPRQEERKYLYSEIFTFVRDLFIILSIFILFGVFVAQPVTVEGISMLPTIHDGERLIVNKLIYYKWRNFPWSRIERGDVVVLWYPKDPDKSFVKRVIGLPGETVEIRNGVVYINGYKLEENYLDSQYNQGLANLPLKKIDEHYYFVMGDNRDSSSDSRYWGLVPEKYIYGKAFFRFWPIDKIGFINRGGYELKLDGIDKELERSYK